MILLFILGVLAWFVGLMLYRTLVITMLWYWFAVPAFGVKPLTMAVAFGLSTLVALFTQELSKTATESKKADGFGEVAGALATPFVTVSLFLLFGWVAHLFV